MRITDTRPGGPPGDCLRACVATLLDQPYDQVPHFALAADWWDELRRWARTSGGDFGCVTPTAGRPQVLYAPGTWPGLLIAAGPSPRAVPGERRRHAVVADVDLTVVHDPHPSRAGLLNVDEVYVHVPPYDPAPPTAAA